MPLHAGVHNTEDISVTVHYRLGPLRYACYLLRMTGGRCMGRMMADPPELLPILAHWIVMRQRPDRVGSPLMVPGQFSVNR